jgi:TatD DNase family protein
MPPLLDIHCHLDHPYFKNQIDTIIKNARKAGIKAILTNGVNPETNRITLELAKKYPVVKPALGIYPVELLKEEIRQGAYPLKTNDFDLDKELEFIKKNKDKIIAIGEIGLDGTHKDSLEQQKQHFTKLLELAENIKKPVIIHSRKAESDVIDILQSTKIKKILLHCFCGKKKLIKQAADNGYYFSIPTNVVRAQNFQELIKMVNINQLFAETDSPYLSPYKDKRNQPAFVIESYKKIAEIKGFTLEEVENNIWMNWMRILS